MSIARGANYWIAFVDDQGRGMVSYAVGSSREQAQAAYDDQAERWRRGESEFQHLAGVELRTASWHLIDTTGVPPLNP